MHPSFLAAAIEDPAHHFFSSNYFRNIITKEFMWDNLHYMNLFEYQSGSYYSYFTPEVFRTTNNLSSYYALSYSKKMYFGHIDYVVTTYYNLNTSISHIEKLIDEYFTDYALIDRYGDILYATSADWQQPEFGLSELFPYSNSSDNKLTSSGVYYYQKNAATGWILVAYSPYAKLLSNTFTIFYIITLLYFISPLLYGLFLIPTTSGFLSPLAFLYNSMKNYTAGDTVSLDIHTGDEIEKLSDIYGQMTRKIKHQVDDIKKQEHINAVTNYKLLATQIDPHFIYNTMNIINIMAAQENTDAIIKINSALIKILRERLNSKLTISDTIENELEVLYQFGLIMNYRYENKVYTRVDVDEILLQQEIPKNILQPLVENSFYHGFANCQNEDIGYIDIIIYSTDTELVIEVSDNGTGIDSERLQLLRESSYQIYQDKKPHIGIDNIRQRLEYVYRENYEFNISSSFGYGTTISITLPLKMPEA